MAKSSIKVDRGIMNTVTEARIIPQSGIVQAPAGSLIPNDTTNYGGDTIMAHPSQGMDTSGTWLCNQSKRTGLTGRNRDGIR